MLWALLSYIYCSSKDTMMDFNLDFISHRKKPPAKQAHKKAYTPQHVNELADRLIALCNVKYHIALRAAFCRIQFGHSLRVHKLEMFEQYVLRRKQISFLAIKRYICLSSKEQQLSDKNRLNLPLAIIKKVQEGGRLRCLNWGMDKLRETKVWFDVVKRNIGQIESFSYRYQKRAFLAQFFSIARADSRKVGVYNRYAGYLCWTVNKIQVGLLSSVLNQLAWKTSLKDVAELQKQKLNKRESAQKSGQKRTEVIVDIRRKIHNMKGQVDEGRIELYKKKNDGSRTYAIHTIRKVEQQRNLEVATNKLKAQLDKVQYELDRKENSLSFRPKTQIGFDGLRQIYQSLSRTEDTRQRQKVIANSVPKKHVGEFVAGRHCEVQENVRLNHLINLHERSETVKKLDGYLNAESENSSLKLVLGSLIRMQLMQSSREVIMESAEGIGQSLQGLRREMSKLRVQRVQNKA